jgi:hypothetical protein
VALRCIFCGWWAATRSKYPPRYPGQIPPRSVALHRLLDHFVAAKHGRVL